MSDFQIIEKKWQKKWEDAGIFKVKEGTKQVSGPVSNKGKKFYCLEMFPYPSGAGLHMGHVRNYAMGDCIARFKRMHGFNVLYPMGYDAFGLPAENAAIKNKSHPKIYTETSMSNIEKNQKALGLSYDWTRKFATCYPEYYKWNQWFFLQFLKKGLAYKKEAPVNWCPKCTSVLANEQVEDGKCWRCESQVEEKRLEQWFFKITDYADRLLKDIEKLEWPEKIKKMQENWIGKSEGTEIFFQLYDSKETIPAFTTRPDTIFSVTFIVLAPEHPLVLKFVKGTKYEKGAVEFIEKIKKESLVDRTNEAKEKEGFFIGRHVINPASKEKIPVWIANFAIMDYGTGAVMCDAHDKRDFKFARKYGIPLKFVISKGGNPEEANKAEDAYVDDGILFNSEQFNGLPNREALPKISNWLVKNKNGKKVLNYKIRDWLISRQRYWGTPIPVVYCGKCGALPVPEKDLPVLLPEKATFTGQGNPLANTPEFVNTTCPTCKGKARRETDTMDTFVDSSWYFLRFCNPNFHEFAFDKKAVKYWMTVDQYIGGAEHAVMHLLYARFFTKILKDMGLVGFDEPFKKLFNQGILYKDGHKMSKSFGNVVTQEEMSEKYGIDTARLFLLFVGSPEKEMEWSDKGIEGVFRFINRVYRISDEYKKGGEGPTQTTESASSNKSKDKYIESKMHRTIKSVTETIENFEFNKSIGHIMGFVNSLQGNLDYVSEKTFRNSLENICLLLSPFAPHLSEEVWETLGNKPFVSTEKWPKFDPKKIDEKAEYSEDFVSKVIGDVKEVLSLLKIEKPKQANLFVPEDWKYTLYRKIKIHLEKTHNTGEILKEIMKDAEMRKYGKDIPAIVAGVVKDPSKIPEIILTQKEELGILECSKNVLEKDLGFKVEILPAEKSSSPRAKKADPGKPGIEVV